MDSDEIWKSYPEFNFIQGSTWGRVRTLDRVVPNGKGGKRFIRGKTLKQCPKTSDYLHVGFSVNGKKVDRYVHRIIAETFLPNPNSLLEVNHKDCNPSNNDVLNLEWVTRKENRQYRDKYGASHKEVAKKKSVYAINLATLEVLQFRSQCEASRELGVNQGNINNVIKGRHSHTGGYWFTNADDNAVENTRAKFGDRVANKVEALIAQTATK